MVAEARNHDAQSFRGLDHLRSLWNFYFPIIDDEFRHVGPFSLHGQRILDTLDILDIEALLKWTLLLHNMLPDLILKIGNEALHR